MLHFIIGIHGCFSLKLTPFRDNYLVYLLMIIPDKKAMSAQSIGFSQVKKKKCC